MEFLGGQAGPSIEFRRKRVRESETTRQQGETAVTVVEIDDPRAPGRESKSSISTP